MTLVSLYWFKFVSFFDLMLQVLAHRKSVVFLVSMHQSGHKFCKQGLLYLSLKNFKFCW
jgi:hypothetical protein